MTDQVHFLRRPTTIRKLWVLLWVVLALTVAAQVFIPVEGYFGVDGWFAFAAAFGFLSCAAMVFAAKALGALLKRKDDYYDR
ncbi:hypothetical protein [Gimibacter soli]|uniref:Uncharacterized protein n=1 Tax=Gimibacter soli TaxID=3024400 RepID=A0AAE9XQM4_9PROT|nr:hypothetical protein [Gimibacter soli]WCL54499.1 hypothetical protein PH603_01850 [Gimibacter soli]